VNVTCDPTKLSLSGSLKPHETGTPRLYVPSGFAPGSNVAPVVASNVQTAAALTGNVFWTEEGTQFATTASAYGLEVGPLHLFKVVLNGQDRFKEQSGKYFNQVQPFYHHTGTPYPGVYVYSFALQPEEHQPTGTCNFSRIDNASLNVQLKSSVATTTQKLFAINYNVLRIASGMGGLAFSN
jgi:hypothetical protein